jgi:hypothetical protein
LYTSPSIIRIIKTRRMRWAGHVARIGGRVIHIEFWWEGQKDDEEDLDVDGRIILSRVCVTIDGVWIGEWIY